MFTSTRFFVAAVLIASPILLLLVAFGVHGGMPWDYSLVYVSESQPGPEGFLYWGDTLRVFTNVFYHVGYWTSIALGQDGAFIGYHVVYAAIWLARCALAFAICRSLRLDLRVSLAAAAITAFHGSDFSIGHVGQINQFGLAFWTLLAVWLFVVAIHASWPMRLLCLVLSAASGGVAVWSHEAALLGLMLAPWLLLLAERKLRPLWWMTIVAIPQWVYAYLMADRLLLHPTGNSFQEAVTRNDLDQIGTLLSDAGKLVLRLFDVSGWVSTKLGQSQMTVAGLISNVDMALIVVALMLAVLCAAVVGLSGRKGANADGRRELELAGVFFVLAVAFVAPFLALQLGSNLQWRTQILPSGFAAIASALLLDLIFARIQAWASAAWVTVLTAIFACGIVANIASYWNWNLAWQRIANPMSRFLRAVPNVKADTIILLQGVPVEYKGWGSNFWFDLLCRLAYPHIKVTASYSFAGNPDDAKNLAIIHKQWGEAYTLPDGRKILLPHGHAFGIVGRDVSLAKTYISTVINGGTIDQVVVVQWTDNGPMKIVTDLTRIDMAVTPANDYDPGKRLLSNPNPVAQRRFAIR